MQRKFAGISSSLNSEAHTSLQFIWIDGFSWICCCFWICGDYAGANAESMVCVWNLVKTRCAERGSWDTQQTQNPSLPILVRTYHRIVALCCQPAIQIQEFDSDLPFQPKKNDRNFGYKFSRQQVSEFCQGTLFFKCLNQPFFFCANFSIGLPGEEACELYTVDCFY